MVKKDIVTRAFHGGSRVTSKQIRLGKKLDVLGEVGEILTPHGIPGVDYSKKKKRR